MEILGIGPLELLFILMIALIILGPGDMVKAGRTLGRFMRRVVTSSEWRTVQRASRELRYLPNRLMREATLNELSSDLKDINKVSSQISSDVKKIEKDLSSWTTPPGEDQQLTNLPESEENKILPTVEKQDQPSNDK